LAEAAAVIARAERDGPDGTVGSQTVAALGPMIDSLRARGDTLVLLSDLAGFTREEAMPPLPPSSAIARLIELASFGLVGGLDWAMHWILLIAVALGGIVVGLTLLVRVELGYFFSAIWFLLLLVILLVL